MRKVYKLYHNCCLYHVNHLLFVPNNYQPLELVGVSYRDSQGKREFYRY